MAQRAEHQIQVVEVLGSMLTAVKFCCWNFFRHDEASDADIDIVANFCLFLKNLLWQHNANKKLVIGRPGTCCKISSQTLLCSRQFYKEFRRILCSGKSDWNISEESSINVVCPLLHLWIHHQNKEQGTNTASSIQYIFQFWIKFNFCHLITNRKNIQMVDVLFPDLSFHLSV